VPGCRAVATASAAIAAAHGYPDGECIPVELMLAAIGRIATAVDLPTTADLELGYGDVDTTIRRAVQLGVAGANLEDALRPLPTAVRIVEQALRAGAAEGVPLVLNAHRPLPAARGLAAGCAARRDPPARPGVPRRRSRLRVRARLHRPRRNLHPREQFGPGRLSLLAVPGLPPPGHLLRLGVARLSHRPAPHRHALAALTDLAAGLHATTTIDN